MSAKLHQIHSVLETLDNNWSWEFIYAPTPGQPRIKVMAKNKAEPGRVKTIILSKAVVDDLPPSRIAQSLVGLLSVIPEARESIDQFHNPIAEPNLKRHYEVLRKLYKANLAELKTATRRLSESAEETHIVPIDSGGTKVFAHWNTKPSTI